MSRFNFVYSTIAWKHMQTCVYAKTLSDALVIMKERYGDDITILDISESIVSEAEAKAERL